MANTDAPTERVLPGHGTRARYLHRSHACHCQECTAANAAYIRHWRAGHLDTRPPVHPAQLKLWGRS